MSVDPRSMARGTTFRRTNSCARTRCVRSFGITKVRSIMDESFERSVARDAREMLLRVGAESGLDASQLDEYVEQGEEELRARLHGWPPNPPKVNKDWRWMEKMAKQLEESSLHPVCLRRIYATDHEVGIIAIVERLEDVQGGGHLEGRKDRDDHVTLNGNRMARETNQGELRAGSVSGTVIEKSAVMVEPAPNGHAENVNGTKNTAAAVRNLPSRDSANAGGWRISLHCDAEIPLKIHWGLTGKGEKQGIWLLPPEETRPTGSECSDDACDVDLEQDGPMKSCEILIQESSPVPGIYFVAQRVDNQQWLKASDGGDFFVPLPGWEAAEERRNLELLGFFDQVSEEPTDAWQAEQGNNDGVDLSEAENENLVSMDLIQSPVMYEQQYQLEGGRRLLISVQAGNKEKVDDGSVYTVELLCDIHDEGPLILHWGLAQENMDCQYELSNSTDLSECIVSWKTPSEAPDNSECEDSSCNTQFDSISSGTWKRATVHLRPHDGIMGIYFVLQVGQQWVSDADGKDFYVPIPSGILHQLATEAAHTPDVMHQHIFPLGRSGSSGHLLSLISEHNMSYMIELFSDSPEPLVLHWGVAEKEPFGWKLPPEGMIPPGSVLLPRACETPFFVAPASLVKELHSTFVRSEVKPSNTESPPMEAQRGLASLQRACILVPREFVEIVGLTFVLRNEDSSKWFKDQWNNFFITWHVDELS